MKTILTKASIVIFLLSITLFGTSIAQSVSVGVSAGNTFDYSYKINWVSTDPSATVPAEDVRLNDTEYIRLNVVNVEGTLLNVDFVRHYSDGAETRQNGNIDVNTQVLEVPYSTLIIRAGANTGEKIYPFGGHAILSETATRSYSIGQVDTIRYVSPETSEANFEKTEIIYDRANGVGVEYNFVSRETSGSYVTTTTETLMIKSWVIPEFPVSVVFLVMLIAIPIALIVCRKTVLSNHKFAVFFGY
jgi:hypothetical protein